MNTDSHMVWENLDKLKSYQIMTSCSSWKVVLSFGRVSNKTEAYTGLSFQSASPSASAEDIKLNILICLVVEERLHSIYSMNRA